MKTLYQLLAIGGLAIAMSACGGGSSGTTAASSTVCSTGQVYTSYGCITQNGSCTINGTTGTYYNSQCVQITSGTTGTCTVAGQVQTSMGCITSQGVCTVPGTTTQGVLYNGQCYQQTYTSGYGSTCTVAGQVQTSMGCITQNGSCSINGTTGTYYNGQCIQITSTGTYGYNNGQCMNGQTYINGTCQYVNGGVNTGVYNGGYNGGYNPGMGNQQCYSTQFGCLYQGMCGYGQVQYNNQCFTLIPMTTGYRGYGGGGSGFGFHINFGL